MNAENTANNQTASEFIMKSGQRNEIVRLVRATFAAYIHVADHTR